MKSRITLQYATFARDEIGGTIETWHDMATIWAKITPLRGAEVFRHQKHEYPQNLQVAIRYRDGIYAGMRILHKNQILRINTALNKNDANNTLELHCERII
jgi:SPP1 family predicted phage head-tail adaptor